MDFEKIPKYSPPSLSTGYGAGYIFLTLAFLVIAFIAFSELMLLSLWATIVPFILSFLVLFIPYLIKATKLQHQLDIYEENYSLSLNEIKREILLNSLISKHINSFTKRRIQRQLTKADSKNILEITHAQLA
jgi:Ca2+/Na+ antiporter